MKKILVIQTAFIGDVILATALLEQLHQRFPKAVMDVLVRQGNEQLFDAHPYLSNVLVWNKKNRKYINLFKLLSHVRKERYDLVVNVQRYAASAFITAFSGASQRVGFDSHWLSLGYSMRVPHRLGAPGQTEHIHEVKRCLSLIAHLCDETSAKPRLYPSDVHRLQVEAWLSGRYITISPASVWFTKQTPKQVWSELIRKSPTKQFYLLGSAADIALCNEIAVGLSNVEVLAGKFPLLESALIMQHAEMNYTNDSAPLHLCSAVNAPTTAVFCSTVPEFGFGPLADNSVVIQSNEDLPCKPCGNHGKSHCPQGHFKCGNIEVNDLIKRLN